jgi:hypothetical protein
MNQAIDLLLRRWTAWYRLRRAVNVSLSGMNLGFALAIGISLALLLQGRILRGEFLLVTIASGLTGAILTMVAALLWKVDALQVARLFDHEFNLHDRTATAVELRRAGWNADHPSADLYEKQFQDTISAGQSVRANRRFLAPLSTSQWLFIGILIAVEVLIIFGGGALFQKAEAKRSFQKVINSEIVQIETLQEAITEDQTLTTEQKEELLRQLQQAKESLSDAESYEQAVAILASTENQLEAMSDPQAERLQQILQDAGNNLLQEGSVDGSPLESTAQNMAEGDLLAAAQDLTNLDLENLSPEEIAALAEQLHSISESVETAHPELASQLQEAAQALRNGDIQSAQQALQQASNTLANTSQRLAGSQAASQAATQLSQGEGRLVQAGRNVQAQNTQGTGPGQSQGQGEGQGQSQGSSQQPGQGGSSGAGEGTGSQETGSGVEAGNTPIDQGNKPGDGGLVPYERIYSPERLGGTNGEDVQLPVSGEQGDVIGLTDTSPGDPGASSVPYNQIYATYAQVVRQAIENGQVPPSFRSIVREYFSSLEP